MGGFFDSEDVEVERGDEAPRVRKIAEVKNYSCEDCGLYKSCNTPKSKPTGQGSSGVLVVMEGPSKEEDSTGRRLSGESGGIFKEALEAAGYSLKDIWITNAPLCRSGAEVPSPIQLQACSQVLKELVGTLKPKAIITLGKNALDCLFFGRMMGQSLGDFVGEAIPDQIHGTWVFPTWAPMMVLKQYRDPVMLRQIAQTIKRAIENQEPFPTQLPVIDDVEILTSESQVVQVLNELRSRSALAYDYETTSKKPQRGEAAIWSASISDGEKAWSFPFFKGPEFLKAWKRLLTSPRIKKICQNGKFEALWTFTKLGYWPDSLHWDTMLASHCLNNKQSVGLKFQTFLKFGVPDYSKRISGFFESTPAEKEKWGANALNMVHKAPQDELLLYGGLDSLYTFHLWKIQEQLASDHVLQGIRFLTESSMWLAKAESQGIQLSEAAAVQVQEEITQKLDRIENRVLSMEEIKQWDRPTRFRLSAPADLTHLVFDILKYKPESYTATGKPAADKEAMEKIDLPIVKKVMEWRTWAKVRDTYIKGFLREAVDGVIHPSFNIHTVDTFRSSSDAPNFQNVPKRDPKTSKPIRLLLRPRPGHYLAEFDYKAVEVGISSCYNKDPVLIKYITDPSTDMHRDMGEELFLYEPGTLPKAARGVAKNSFVFPEFYGSYYEQVAPDLWNKAPPETKEHLKEKGFKTLAQYKEHVKAVEASFWGERFSVYASWKKKNLKQYESRGYIDLHTGFRCLGPMKRNEVSNYGTQGSAFHCLLRTFNRVSWAMEKLGMDSKIIGQIHDAIVADISPEEEEMVDKLVWYYGTQEIREAWGWILVPLSIEKSRSAVDGSWAEMEDCGLLDHTGFVPEIL